MKKTILLSAFCFVCSLQCLAQGGRYYVHTAATGANNGQSWSDAFTDLQSALQVAEADDEIWVAHGLYKPTNTTDRSISFEPKSGVKLYGGFAGTEDNIGTRDWNQYPTILSGDIGIQDDSTDNSYTVLYLHEPDSSSLLDGFTLRDGVADFEQLSTSRDRRKCGGGLYIMGEDAEAYPGIRNCRFIHNTARNAGGGAMVNGGGDGSVAPMFFNCHFENNNSWGSGGGLAYTGAAWVERGMEVDSCSFFKNQAGINGGGAYFLSAEGLEQLDIVNSQFIENSTSNLGGGLCLQIGRSDGINILLDGLGLIRNSAQDGSALYILPANFSYTKDISINNCNISENYNLPTATNTPVDIAPLFIDFENAKCTLKESKFESNTSNGILLIEGSNGQNGVDLLMEGNVFKNHENPNGLRLSIFNRVTFINQKLIHNEMFGGLISLVRIQSFIFSNCLVSNNANTQNISRYFNFTLIDSVCIRNSVFYNNDITIKNSPPYPNYLLFQNSSASNIEHKDRFLQANVSSIVEYSYFDTLNCSTLPPNITCGPGILTGIDPLFVNPDSGDYRLQPCSPLINAGSNDYVMSATDLAGLPRIRGGTVDIGAYESQGPALSLAPQVTPSCPDGASGAVEPEVQDACLPVVYNWQSGASSGNQLNGLPPGDYQFTITDAKGQTGTFSVNIPTGDSPELLPLSTALVCGDTIGGSATAALNPATPPLQYLWAGGSTDSLRTGLAAGSYSLTLTDANGCSATGMVQVDKTGSLSVDIDVQEISCNGAADGAFTVLPGNGKAPYKWLWESGANTPMIGPLGPGNYTGTLTDALGCTIQWVLPLGQPGSLQSNAVVTNANDSTAANGRIELLPNGGTTPYTILWSTGATGPVLDSLLPGIYTATLTDANDCILVETYTVGVTSGTNEADVVYDAQLYPNPAVESVWLILDRPAKAQLPVRVLNSAGQEVLREQLPVGAKSWLFQVADLPRGLYFVQIQGFVRKLVLR